MVHQNAIGIYLRWLIAISIVWHFQPSDLKLIYEKGRKGVACKVHGLKYLKVDTLSIKVVPDDLYYDYNNLAQA